MDADDMKRHYVIRFINTRLVGCEYVIRDNRTTYIVADRHTIATAQNKGSDPATIYVLDDSINTRFDILYDTGMSLPLLLVSETEKAINFQQIINVDGVKFALRPEDSEWQALVTEGSQQNEGEGSVIPAPAVKHNTTGVRATLVVLLILALAAGIFALYQRDDSEVASLNQALGGKPHEFKTFIGRDSQLYIYAQEAQSSRWAWQSLIRNNIDKQATILSAKAVEENISREIASRWPQVKFHALRFDDPSRPEIILSQERSKMVDPAQLEAISAELVSLFSWAHKFSFGYISDNIIARSAEQSLSGVVPAFNKRDNGDSVTFSVRAELNDGELNAIKQVVDDFRTKWRGGYVQFDIQLETNRLKGKSYLYGNDGYVKITSEQWYFPESK